MKSVSLGFSVHTVLFCTNSHFRISFCCGSLRFCAHTQGRIELSVIPKRRLGRSRNSSSQKYARCFTTKISYVAACLSLRKTARRLCLGSKAK